jgi:hypothetical protein
MTPGLFEAVKALMIVFEPIQAPSILVSCRAVLTIMFGFGDASGKGFGSAFQMKAGSGLLVWIGVWPYNESEESSNW